MPETRSAWAVLVAAGRGERLGADRPKAFVALGGRVAAGREPRAARRERRGSTRSSSPCRPTGRRRRSCSPRSSVADKVTAVVTGGATRARVGARRARRGARRRARRARPRRRPAARRRRRDRARARAARRGLRRRRARRCRSPTRSSGSRAASSSRPSIAPGSSRCRRRRRSPRPALRAAYAGDGSTTRPTARRSSRRRGGRVRVVDGDRRLLKITTAADLALVESWLRAATREGGVLRRRRDARRRGALVAGAGRAGGPAAARDLGRARSHDRARRGAQRALGSPGHRAADRLVARASVRPRRPVPGRRSPASRASARSACASASSATRPPRSSAGRARRRCPPT